MFGANLVSVQRLLGHSDPRITERRYGHLLPDFMQAEVKRLRFGIDQLAPQLAPALPRDVAGKAGSVTVSPAVAGASTPFGAPVVRNEGRAREEAGAPENSRGVPASSMAGSTGLETAGTQWRNLPTGHAFLHQSHVAQRLQSLGAVHVSPRESTRIDLRLGDILETPGALRERDGPAA
jgi:hypothetical protein